MWIKLIKQPYDYKAIERFFWHPSSTSKLWTQRRHIITCVSLQMLHYIHTPDKTSIGIHILNRFFWSNCDKYQYRVFNWQLPSSTSKVWILNDEVLFNFLRSLTKDGSDITFISLGRAHKTCLSKCSYFQGKELTMIILCWSCCGSPQRCVLRPHFSTHSTRSTAAPPKPCLH